jgi:hypothetical protein
LSNSIFDIKFPSTQHSRNFIAQWSRRGELIGI